MEVDNYIPISYLSQYYYCPRRAGLLILEQVWAENEYTAAGREEHANVHTPGAEKRGKLIRIHDFAVYSRRLGLSGKCDLIEAVETSQGCTLSGYPKLYSLNPVEFKHGVVRQEYEYQIQLCAQAICLEEMLSTSIQSGEIFYITAHRRDEVAFNSELRNAVESGAVALREMILEKKVPPASYGARCKKCSLHEYCQPNIKSSAINYCNKALKAACEIGDFAQ